MVPLAELASIIVGYNFNTEAARRSPQTLLDVTGPSGSWLFATDTLKLPFGLTREKS